MKGLEIAEQNHRAGQRWQSLTEEEKEPYLKKSEEIAKRQSKMLAAVFMKIILL